MSTTPAAAATTRSQYQTVQIMDNDDKIVKLQHATDEAHAALEHCEQALQDSQQHLTFAKELLQSMDPQDQERILITDTKYPELLALHQIAQDNYETALKRYQTNKRYLDQFVSRV